ncbi:MAG: glycosyltransferase, partial [Gammaproteobacteria bacterium]
RHSLDQWRDEKRLLRGEIRVSGWLAGMPDRIIFNSVRAARQHERLGYPETKVLVIPNGFDLEKFSPNTARRASVRVQLHIEPDAVVLGMIARYHPLKDHANFLRAARVIAGGCSGVRFVLVGRGITAENRVLTDIIRELGLGDRVLLLGERDDVPDLLNACDVYVSSSSSEAFPNAVGEAMSCGISCVVTNAGDSAELVADTGIVVPPKSPERLAEAVLQLIRAGADRRRELGAAARERIRLNYSNKKIAQQYADLYRSVCVRA